MEFIGAMNLILCCLSFVPFTSECGFIMISFAKDIKRSLNLNNFSAKIKENQQEFLMPLMELVKFQ